MSSPYDLLILPLVRTGGQEQPNVPGLYIPSPPRKSARFRSRDKLVLHLILDGNSPLPQEHIDQILTNLAKTYYNTPGTVTTAQRAVAESLNQYLLDRNLRNSSTGRQAVGYLTQIVLRDTRLAIAQSGLSHAFMLSAGGVEHIHDLNLAGNGLGLSRTTYIRYSQLALQPNDAIVITIQPPATWTEESLSAFRGQGPESLRRKLLSIGGTELNAFLLHAQPGSGKLRVLRPAGQPRPVPIPLIPQPMPVDTVDLSKEGIPLSGEAEISTPAAVEEPAQDTAPVSDGPTLAVGSTAVSHDPPLSQAAESSTAQPTQAEPSQPKAAPIGSGIRSISNTFLKAIASLTAFMRQIPRPYGLHLARQRVRASQSSGQKQHESNTKYKTSL